MDFLTQYHKGILNELLDKEMDDVGLINSLYDLSEILHEYYHQKVILLIDEYDVPLAKANELGYYDEMVLLVRNLFERALKTNENLHFAVLTGCLRVAKESIFTGLNNPKILSITTVRFDEYFGFTDREVKKLLAYYGLEDKYEKVKEWYDGYHFGDVDVYCPWDVISYCDELTDDPEADPKAYWSNTSGNDVVRHFIEQMNDERSREELEELVGGEKVVKEIHEELTYSHLYDSVENIWSVLFMTGYLTYCGKPEGKMYRLAIPNMEIRNIFAEQIMKMFLGKVEKDGEHLEAFCSALLAGEATKVERLFTEYLSQTISIRDTFVKKAKKENFLSEKATTKASKIQKPSVCFYHGILLGILGYKKNWYVRSNEESGDGYSDILIRVRAEEIGIIIEVKYAENGSYEAACHEALEQMEHKQYIARLEADGYRKVLKYGIACFRKRCRVAVEKQEI